MIKSNPLSYTVIDRYLILLLLLLIMSALAGCGRVCEEKTIRKYTSPNSKYVAVLFERNCGAVSSTETHVNLRRSWSWFSSEPEGAIFDGEVFLGTEDVNVTWTDSNNLYIESLGGAKAIQSCKLSWNEVTILCKAP